MQSDDGVIVNTSFGHEQASCEINGERYLVPKEVSQNADRNLVCHLYVNAGSTCREGAFGVSLDEAMLRRLRQDLRAAFEAAGFQVVFR